MFLSCWYDKGSQAFSKKSFSADSLNYIRGKSHGKNKVYTRGRS